MYSDLEKQHIKEYIIIIAIVTPPSTSVTSSLCFRRHHLRGRVWGSVVSCPGSAGVPASGRVWHQVCRLRRLHARPHQLPQADQVRAKESLNLWGVWTSSDDDDDYAPFVFFVFCCCLKKNIYIFFLAFCIGQGKKDRLNAMLFQ